MIPSDGDDVLKRENVEEEKIEIELDEDELLT